MEAEEGEVIKSGPAYWESTHKTQIKMGHRHGCSHKPHARVPPKEMRSKVPDNERTAAGLHPRLYRTILAHFEQLLSSCFDIAYPKSLVIPLNHFMCAFQSGVRRNGRMVQQYPPVIEAHEEEQKESDEAMPVSLSTGRNRTPNLSDTDGICSLTRDGQKATKTAEQSSRRPERKIQIFPLTSLDPSNLNPR